MVNKNFANKSSNSMSAVTSLSDWKA